MERQAAGVLVEQAAAVVGVAVDALVANVREQVGARRALRQGDADVEPDSPVQELDLAFVEAFDGHARARG